MNSDDYATFKSEYPLAANCLLEKYVSYTEERTHPSMSPPHKKYRISGEGSRVYGPQNLQILLFFSFFSDFCNFQLNLCAQYLHEGTRFRADIFTINITHSYLLDEACFNRF